jgi:hypothetical protein
MRFTEKFNQHKLKYVIENKDKFDFRVTDPSYDPIKQMKKYLDRSRDGSVVVDYHQAHGRAFGRWFANEGCSLQNLSREIRHTIAQRGYIDIDIVNCHPVLLVQICKANGIDCEDIEDFVNDREKYIQEVIDKNPSMTREDVKTTFLSLLNGGQKAYKNIENKTRFLKQFRRQTEDILEEVKDKFPDEYKFREDLKDSNISGSTLNAILCQAENECLMVILEELRDNNLVDNNAVLCFDGLMIPVPDTEDTNLNLTEIEQCVKRKTTANYDIKLKIKPMDKGYEIPEDIPLYSVIKAFDPDDPFTWLDFVHKYHGQTFTSDEHLLESTIKDLNRIYAWVEGSTTNHVRKTDTSDNLFDIIDGRGRISKLFFKVADDKGKVKKITFDQYITDFLLNIKTYQSIDFDPSMKNSRMFNLWTGYKATLTDFDTIEPLQRILKHIREVYCSDSEEVYEYFLDLLYMMFKVPEKSLGVAVFLFSRTQGTGKNTFIDFLRDCVVGNQMTYECAGLDSLISKHNSMMKNKKLVVVDEIASSAETWHSNFDKMKTLITSENIVINPKGVNQFIVKNLATYFFLSNNPDAIRLESTDRRYLCLEVSNKYVGNTAYFNSLRDTFTQENGNIFYSWLLKRGDDTSRVINIRKIPVTQFKKDIIHQSASSSTLFLDYLKENRDELKDDEFSGVDEDYIISATRVYELYESWCKSNGEKIKKQRKFFLDIKGMVEKRRIATGQQYDLSTI